MRLCHNCIKTFGCYFCSLSSSSHSSSTSSLSCGLKKLHWYCSMWSDMDASAVVQSDHGTGIQACSQQSATRWVCHVLTRSCMMIGMLLGISTDIMIQMHVPLAFDGGILVLVKPSPSSSSSPSSPSSSPASSAAAPNLECSVCNIWDIRMCCLCWRIVWQCMFPILYFLSTMLFLIRFCGFCF